MILEAGTLGTVTATVTAFLLITLSLVGLLLFVKQKLSPSGPVKIKINGEKEIEVASGASLLSTLGNEKIFLPSACGGGGTCIQCECHVLDGGGEALPTETPHFTRKELKHGARLACQVKVKQNMEITIPEEVFGIKKWEATVVRNYNVASFIKEFVVEIPEDMNYKAGGYIQIEIPECEVKYSDIDITAHPEEHESPDKFKMEWDKFNLWPLVMKNGEKNCALLLGILLRSFCRKPDRAGVILYTVAYNCTRACFSKFPGRGQFEVTVFTVNTNESKTVDQGGKKDGCGAVGTRLTLTLLRIAGFG